MARWQVLLVLLAVMAGCASAFLDDIFDAIGDGIGTVVGGVGDIVEDIGDGLGDAVGAIGDGVGDVVDGVGDAIDGLGDVLDGVPIVGDVVDGVGDVVDGVGDAVDFVGDGLEDAVDTIGDVAGDAFDAIGDVAEDVVGGIGDVVDSFGDGVVMAFTDPGEFIKDVIDTVLSLPEDIVEGVVEFSDTILNHVERLPFVGKVVEQGRKALAPLFDAAAKAVAEFGEVLGDFMGVLLVGLSDAFDWVVSGLADLLACIIDAGAGVAQEALCLALLSGCDCEDGKSFVSLGETVKARCAAPIEFSQGLQMGKKIGSANLQDDLVNVSGGCTGNLSMAIRGGLNFQPAFEVEVSPLGDFKFEISGAVQASAEALVNASGTCNYVESLQFAGKPKVKMVKIKHVFFYLVMFGGLDVSIQGTLDGAVKALVSSSFNFKATGEVSTVGGVSASARSEGLTYRHSVVIGGSMDATLELTLTPHFLLIPFPAPPVHLRPGVTIEVKGRGAGEWIVSSSRIRRLARSRAPPANHSLSTRHSAASSSSALRGASVPPSSSRMPPRKTIILGERRQLSGTACFMGAVSVLATVQASSVSATLLNILGDLIGETLVLGAEIAVGGLVGMAGAAIDVVTQCFFPPLAEFGDDITGFVRAAADELLNGARVVLDTLLPSFDLDSVDFLSQPFFGETLVCKTLASTSCNVEDAADFLTCPVDPVAHTTQHLPSPTSLRRAMVLETMTVTSTTSVTFTTGSWSTTDTSSTGTATSTSTTTRTATSTQTSTTTSTATESSTTTSTSTSSSSTWTTTSTLTSTSTLSSSSSTFTATSSVTGTSTHSSTSSTTSTGTSTSTRSSTLTSTSSVTGTSTVSSTITPTSTVSSTSTRSSTMTSTSTLSSFTLDPGTTAAQVQVSSALEVYSDDDVNDAMQDFVGIVLDAIDDPEATSSISSKISARLTFSTARRLSGNSLPMSSSSTHLALAPLGKMADLACAAGTEVEVEADTLEQLSVERLAAIDSHSQALCAETAATLAVSIRVTTENTGVLKSAEFESQVTQALLSEGFNAPLILTAAVTETTTTRNGAAATIPGIVLGVVVVLCCCSVARC